MIQASFKNPQSTPAELQLFASINQQGLATNQFAFSFPYSASYPSGTVVNIVVNNKKITATTTGSLTRLNFLVFLQGLGVATAWKLDPKTANNTYYAFSSTNTFQSMEILQAKPTPLGFPASQINVSQGKIYIIATGGSIYESNNGGVSFTASPFTNAPTPATVLKNLAISYPFQTNAGKPIGVTGNYTLLVPPYTTIPWGAIYGTPTPNQWTWGASANMWAKSKFLSINSQSLFHDPSTHSIFSNTMPFAPFTPPVFHHGANVVDASGTDADFQFDQFNNSNNGSIVFWGQEGVNPSNVYYCPDMTANAGNPPVLNIDNGQVTALLGATGDICLFVNIESGNQVVYAMMVGGGASPKIAKCIINSLAPESSMWSIILDGTNIATPFTDLSANCPFAVDFTGRSQNIFAMSVSGISPNKVATLWQSTDGGSTWFKSDLPITGTETPLSMMYLNATLMIGTDLSFYQFV